MLIIAIGHGTNTDSYTCSCSAKNSEVDADSLKSVMKYLGKKHPCCNNKKNVDELIVVKDEDVVAHYTWEDGLGE